MHAPDENDLSASRSPLSKFGAWVRSGYEDLKWEANNQPFIFSMRAAAYTGVAAYGGAFLGLTAMLFVDMSPSPSQTQDQIISLMQESHGAYARGIADGLTLNGVRLPPETAALLDQVSPIFPTVIETGNDLMRERMRSGGMVAGLSGEIGVEALHDYATFIRDLPDAARDLVTGLEARLSALAGDTRAGDLATLAVTIGLLSDQGEIRGEDMREATRMIASQVAPERADQIASLMSDAAERAAEVRTFNRTQFPDPEGLNEILSDLIKRDTESVLKLISDVRTGPAP